jgi:transcription-repair coupling factor (superfamily II helicase)
MNIINNQALSFDFSKNDLIFAKAPLFVELYTSLAAQQKPVLLVCKNGAELKTRLKNLQFFAEQHGHTIAALPFDERTVMHKTSADPLIRMERMATRFRVAMGEGPQIVVMSFEALLERGPTTKDLLKHAQILVQGEKVNRDRLISALLTLGYMRVPHVQDRGAFAVRGGIIDIFVNQEKRPVRLDFFGDELESIKWFDESTQRSLTAIDSITIGGVKEIYFDEQSVLLAEKNLADLADQLNFPTHKLNEKIRDIENGIHFYGIEKLLPAFYERLSSTLEIFSDSKDKLPHIIFDDREAIFAGIDRFLESIESGYQQALHSDLIFAPHDYFLSAKDLKAQLAAFSFTDIASLTKGSAQVFPCHPTTDIREQILTSSAISKRDEETHLLKPLASRIKALFQQQMTVIITVSSREHEIELGKLLEPMGINLARLKELPAILDAHQIFKPHIHAHTLVSKRGLSFGAVFDFLKVALIAEDDIFGKRTKRDGRSGKQQSFNTSVSDLEINDFVVHTDHGIGQFKGLVRLNVRGLEHDYVLIHYANEEKLYLPTHRINLIKPHGAGKDGTLRLDKLGGTVWASKKSKVKEAVMAMAQDLLKLYAKREIVERPPFLDPDEHFVEFSSNFEFETTPDQQKAIDDVISDMQRKRPMDRLVCGDVGFGKTEVAMRAAMLAVLSKRQVALLAPTTVLAQQHGLTFAERFKNTGVNIAVLSRFQKAAEIKQILTQVKNNQVDIVIGTHRLLSPDVHFSDLGLIVIDEEQRFGIKAKEHLKKMRTKVDVLTMSATPIPRTMQMSYFGIRDLSIIETPPVDRRAIETQVVQFDDAMIKESIMRELSRGGQVYFVHNRVQTINATADYLKLLVPEARIMVAHGQMDEKSLEAVMIRFINHEINVLVCTTIIETGIDVPNANTMFINDADDFGLSQLYQLRGRIGRSKERAYAYLLIKQTTEHLTPIARTRLEILNKFSELGAGFRIAQHDLELRGAGDLLGKSQHGHMAAVGYDLYAELLKDAVKALKGQADEEAIEPEVILPVSALISETYCPDLHERMGFYQRLASADSQTMLDSIFFDLADLYGDAPPEALALKVSGTLKLALKKIYALKLEVVKKEEGSLVVSITLAHKAPVDHQKLMAIMKESTNFKVTPQHKVIQTLPIAHTNINDAVLEAGMQAIKNTVQRLFL